MSAIKNNLGDFKREKKQLDKFSIYMFKFFFKFHTYTPSKFTINNSERVVISSFETDEIDIISA